MRLTQWTDYSLRVLMYCAVHRERAQPVTVSEIAEAHGISRSHLTKIVMTLASLGYLETTRGRGGGLRLLREPGQIVLGEVVRHTETDFNLVECFDPAANQCRIDGLCGLKHALADALGAWLARLDALTLADVVQPPPAAVQPLRRLPRPGPAVG